MGQDIIGQCVHGFNIADCEKCEEVLKTDSRISLNGWTDINLEKPKKQLGVLAFVESEDICVVAFFDRSGKWVEPYTYEEIKNPVTHWMELPKFPFEK